MCGSPAAGPELPKYHLFLDQPFSKGFPTKIAPLSSISLSPSNPKMAPLAFATPVALTVPQAFSGRGVSSRAISSGAAVARMSVADDYMSKVAAREAKQAATPFGVYTVQCTEGTSSSYTAESTRLAVLASSFRLRQASESARYADLYATRRAAVIAAAGSHEKERYAVKFPARAAAGVLGRAEALRACSRYFVDEGEVEEKMFECVDRQYKMMKVPFGTYSTMCCDGRNEGDAETARTAGLAASFRAGTMGGVEKAQMRYNASLEAVFTGRGCDYEEKMYCDFPKMASAIRWSTGAYAARIGGVLSVIGGELMTVEEQVKGINLDAYWPSNEIRAAVERDCSSWNAVPACKNYAWMSEAAVKYGIRAQSDAFVEDTYLGWTAGWQPSSSVGYGM